MGGGKEKGTVAAETPSSLKTLTAIGSQLDPIEKGFDEEAEDTAVEKIAKKKLGVRGLRIPKQSPSI